ncbi:30S ribosomal protein S19e [uncultured archaeon]|nr:30S ribosomal protein S19e [uncultured archaeon]
MGVYDVPAAMLIGELAKELKEKIKQPAFALYVKTGINRERAPNSPDWYFTRAASILYRVYKEGELGTGSLRSHYGGRKNRGVRPEHKYKASGKIIRSALQALEKEGLVKKGKKGRVITQKGEKLLFEKSKIAGMEFGQVREKEKAELAERLAKAELARQKAKEARAAQEAAKKQAMAEQAKKAAEIAAAKTGATAPAATAGQGNATAEMPAKNTAEKAHEKGHEAKAQKKTEAENKPMQDDKDKKQFAPVG